MAFMVLRFAFIYRQPHGHPHPKNLGQFNAAVFPMHKITVIQSLQSHITKNKITLRDNGLA